MLILLQSGLVAYIFTLPNLADFSFSDREGIEPASRMKRLLVEHSWTRTNKEGLKSHPPEWSQPDDLIVPYNLARGDPKHGEGICLLDRAEGDNKSCSALPSSA
jgi:hypothetical protein